MASSSVTSKSKYSELETLLSTWEGRYRLRVLSLQLPRAVMIGLALGVVIGVIGYSQQILLAQNLALIVLGVVIGLGTLLIAYVQLFPRSRSVSARYFDLALGLQERLSTAFELLDGQIQTHPELESVQIADALSHARTVDVRDAVVLDFRPREYLLLMTLLLVVLGMIVTPLLLGQDVIVQTPSPFVQQAREDVRDMIETVATDTDLDPVRRDDLLESLDIALERLEEEDLSEDEAFATMSQLDAKIESVENRLIQEADRAQSALEAADQAFSDFKPLDAPERNVDDPVREDMQAGDDASQALDALAQNADNMTESEAQSAQDALEQAMQDLAQSNPELSEAMQSMADALERGDTQGVQQQAQSAQEQLQQQQQQVQQSQASQQTMSELSDQAEQSADNIAQQQAQQNMPQQPASSQDGQPQSANDSQSAQGQQSNESSDEARQGDAQGSQQPSQNMPSDSESDAMGPDSQTAGQGAGDGESDNASLSGSGGQDQGSDTDNQATGEGMSNYEAIYNPTSIDGGGRDEMQLEGDVSDEILAEGDFEDNPIGESRVTYDTVFNTYQDAANRALESDYVPLGLRDVVYDYFTSLEPNAGD